MHNKFIVIAVFVLLLFASDTVSAQNPLEKDTDADGMPDNWEFEHGLNPTDPNDANLDYNYNNLTNLEEYRKGWDPHAKDNDNDGISNYAEFTGLFGFFTDTLDKDTDDDGLNDLEEICMYIDTDNKTQMDEIYPDKDDRSWVSAQLRKLSAKYHYDLDPTNPDVDGDGLDDKDEISKGTSPNTIDWDHDGLSDGDEVHEYKTDPKKRDTDVDGLTDYEEIFGTYGYVTDPKKRDTDGDGISDGEEIFGFGLAPIPPSRYALTYEEFMSGVYVNESITLKAKVDRIIHETDQNHYSIRLKPLNGTKEGNAIVKVKNSYHYDLNHGMIHVDDRFKFTLKEHDTIVVVGKAGKLEGSTREIEASKMFLVLTPAEASTRWLPSTRYVKIRPGRMITPTPSPEVTPTPTPTPVTTPAATTPAPSKLLVPLLTADAKLKKDLEKGNIPKEIKNSLKTKGFPVSKKSSLTREDNNEWMIFDEENEKVFIIKEEGGKLRVYLSPEQTPVASDTENPAAPGFHALLCIGSALPLYLYLTLKRSDNRKRKP